MASNNYIYKMSNAGGMSTVTRYTDMLAGNTTWNPWEPAGAYDALASVTVPSGGAANVTFAGIPTGYKHLQLRSISRGTDAGSSRLEMRVNGDSGSNYAFHYIYGNGSSAFADGYANQNLILFNRITGAGSLANTFGAQVMDILDYSNTSKFKTFRAITGFDENGAGEIQFNSGLWQSTSAITSISFTAESASSFAQHSTFALYGIK
jgi:hypothetical protein